VDLDLSPFLFARVWVFSTNLPHQRGSALLVALLTSRLIQVRAADCTLLVFLFVYVLLLRLSLLHACLTSILKEVRSEEEGWIREFPRKCFKFQRALYEKLLPVLYPDDIASTIFRRVLKLFPEEAASLDLSVLSDLRLFSLSLSLSLSLSPLCSFPTAFAFMGERLVHKL